MEKFATGVEGLDRITAGGLPRCRLTAIAGAAGAGKTILALQILANAAIERGENGVFIAFEETADEILQNITKHDWSRVVVKSPDKKRGKTGFVQIIDANFDPNAIHAGSFDLEGLLAIIASLVKQYNVQIVAFDAINVLLDILEAPRDRRREIFRLQKWVRENSITGIVTLKSSSAELDDLGGYEFVNYQASSVLRLSNADGDRGFERSIQVVKHRGSSHSTSSHPFIIGDNGLEVFEFNYSQIKHDAHSDHISTGIPRLDFMLGGGLHRGSSLLISGSPGTAKTTITGALASAACQRGSKVLFVSYDEAITQIVRNLASVGIDLALPIASGLFIGEAFRAGRFGGRQHYQLLRELIIRNKPEYLVIDPISALQGNESEHTSTFFVESLIDFAKSQGITIVMTSLLEGPLASEESTRAKISSIADTWLHLSFAIDGGERNRALTIVKSRGNAHSNQVRELILSKDGVSLTDVFTSDGAVLMGTARVQRERAEVLKEELRQTAHRREIEDVLRLEATLEVRQKELQLELEALSARKTDLTKLESLRLDTASLGLAELKLRRGSDDLN